VSAADASATAPGALPTVEVAPGDLLALAQRYLSEGFRWYICTTGIESAEGLEVQHFLRNPESGGEIVLRVKLDALAPKLPSLYPVFPGADWSEREAWEMLGIEFEGHPGLRRLLLPAQWDGFPLRKSYPIATPCLPYRPAAEKPAAAVVPAPSPIPAGEAT
jgi:NADH:ubiquinone oxidoreductase subunit C